MANLAPVQNRAAFSTVAASSFALAYNSSPTAGTFLLVSVGWQGAVTISSITDTITNSFVLIGAKVTGGSNQCQVYLIQSNKSTGADTVTVNFSANFSQVTMSISEWSGQAASVLDNNTPVLQASGAGNMNGMVVATKTNELLVLVGTGQGGESMSTPAGFTLLQGTGSNNTFLMYENITPAGTYSPAWSFTSGTQAGAGQLLSLLSSSSSSGGGWLQAFRDFVNKKGTE